MKVRGLSIAPESASAMARSASGKLSTTRHDFQRFSHLVALDLQNLATLEAIAQAPFVVHVGVWRSSTAHSYIQETRLASATQATVVCRGFLFMTCLVPRGLRLQR